MIDHFKLVIFDMDGVLVDIKSSWHYVHKKLGVDSSKNFQKYLNKEINYTEFMRRDIRLWGKCHIDTINRIFDSVPLMTGAKQTVFELRNRGYKRAILSAGISLLADKVNRKLKFDYVCANKLCIDENGFLTGEGVVMVELLSKEAALNELIEFIDISADQCIAIGDSVFDIPVFKKVGLSIAFNTSNNSVKQAADKIIEIKDLRAIITLLN
ncbi:MAG: HAD-IB family phosphatase [Candidatus Hodarchaeota archaeon]